VHQACADRRSEPARQTRARKTLRPSHIQVISRFPKPSRDTPGTPLSVQHDPQKVAAAKSAWLLASRGPAVHGARHRDPAQHWSQRYVPLAQPAHLGSTIPIDGRAGSNWFAVVLGSRGTPGDTARVRARRRARALTPSTTVRTRLPLTRATQVPSRLAVRVYAWVIVPRPPSRWLGLGRRRVASVAGRRHVVGGLRRG
jgi:hypothetical protein